MTRWLTATSVATDGVPLVMPILVGHPRTSTPPHPLFSQALVEHILSLHSSYPGDLPGAPQEKKPPPKRAGMLVPPRMPPYTMMMMMPMPMPMPPKGVMVAQTPHKTMAG